jgi:ribosomal protein S18 acetylase RimI-like enzyme
MVASLEHVVVESEPPDTDRAREILHAYLQDVVGRYYGRKATEDEMRLALREFPSDHLAAPYGIFLVARRDEVAVGCVGLRFLAGRTGEVTRLFVVREAREHGLATQLMDELEAIARGRGLEKVRLDTRRDLVEARRLYARRGYREVAPFSDGPYAEHWFEKTLR